MAEMTWWHVLLHVLGVDNVSGPQYAWWSGAGSDLGELAIVGGLASIYRHRNCEVRRCWRLGRHQTAAGHHVCRRHHPGDHLTAEQVIDDHRAATRARLRGRRFGKRRIKRVQNRAQVVNASRESTTLPVIEKKPPAKIGSHMRGNDFPSDRGERVAAGIIHASNLSPARIRPGR